MASRERRMRRAIKTRAKIRKLKMTRLTVYRTPQHIYAQVITPDGKVVVSASTLDQEISKIIEKSGNVAAAKVVGEYIAERSANAGITKVAFDRSGFKYHGRVLALAASAREHGLEF